MRTFYVYLKKCEKSVADCKSSAWIDVGKSTLAGDESLGEEYEKESREVEKSGRFPQFIL